MRTLRSIMYQLLPAWMTAGPSDRGGQDPEGEGEAFHWTMAAYLDLTIQHMIDALYARFPSFTSDSMLPLHAADRLLLQGRAETPAAFRARLLRWRYPRGHRVRGSAYAWLEQLQIYWTDAAGNRPHVYTIDVSGNRYDRLADGTETYSAGNAWDWDGASASPNWGRIWTVILLPHGMTTTPAINASPWGGLSLGAAGRAGYTLGQTLATPFDCANMRTMLRGKHPWRTAGVREEWIIISTTGDEPAPDGTWSTHQGRLDASQDLGFRFWPIYSHAALPGN